MIYLNRGEFLTCCNPLTCSVSNTVPGEPGCGPAINYPHLSLYLQCCKHKNYQSSSRVRPSEVMKCWNLYSSIFALYFMVQFIIMWWDNIFTQVHSSFLIENGVNDKLSKKLSLSSLLFPIFGTTDLHKWQQTKTWFRLFLKKHLKTWQSPLRSESEPARYEIFGKAETSFQSVFLTPFNSDKQSQERKGKNLCKHLSYLHKDCFSHFVFQRALSDFKWGTRTPSTELKKTLALNILQAKI